MDGCQSRCAARTAGSAVLGPLGMAGSRCLTLSSGVGTLSRYGLISRDPIERRHRSLSIRS
jgi:hypothetical protein